MNSWRPEQLEQPVKIKDSRRRFTMGVPVDSDSACPLTLLTPEGASMLVSQGIEVKIEKGYGNPIHYPDSRYAQAEADIVSRAETLACDVILFGGQLQPKEAASLKAHSILLTLSNNRKHRIETIQELLRRRITVVALDEVRDRRGNRPLSDILYEVAGRASVAAATSFLADARIGKGILLGGVAGVNPCEVVILGTGMAALAAARSAIGLGAMVRLFDSDPYCLRTAISELGAAVIGSTLHPGVLGHALGSADVVISALNGQRFAIDSTVLDNMKKGVVIFDINDHDGISAIFPSLRCVDVTTASERAVSPGSDVCFINPVRAVPRTAAMALTNDIVPIVNRLFGSGSGVMNVLKSDAGLRNAVLFFQGRVVSQPIAERIGVRYVDINLLLSFS